MIRVIEDKRVASDLEDCEDIKLHIFPDLSCSVENENEELLAFDLVGLREFSRMIKRAISLMREAQNDK